MNFLLSNHIEITRLGVANVTDLTDDQITQSLKKISDFESVADWLSGDLLAEMARRDPKVVEARNDNQLEFEFVRHFNSYEVAKAIPIDHRELSLSFAHHREIAAECRSLKEIDEWLAQAAENEWTLANLRKHLRKRSIDTSKAGKVNSQLSWLEPLANMVAKFCKKPAADYSKMERSALKKTIKPLVDLYQQLGGK